MSVFLKIELWKRYCKQIFLALFLLVFVLGLLYVYFMNLAVLKTAERNTNLDKLTKIKRQFQNLEAIYINKMEELNISYAKSLGFVEAEPTDYIYREKSVAQVNNYGQNYR
jgi:hypothetical protein